MKSKFLKYFIFIFAFLFFLINQIKSEELIINATKIISENKGNIIIAKDGVDFKDPSGIIIKSDQAIYDKIQSIVKVKQNVEITDGKNNIILLTDEAIYFVNEKYK